MVYNNTHLLLRRYLQQEQAAMLAEKRYGAIKIYYDVDPL